MVSDLRKQSGVLFSYRDRSKSYTPPNLTRPPGNAAASRAPSMGHDAVPACCSVSSSSPVPSLQPGSPLPYGVRCAATAPMTMAASAIRDVSSPAIAAHLAAAPQRSSTASAAVAAHRLEHCGDGCAHHRRPHPRDRRCSDRARASGAGCVGHARSRDLARHAARRPTELIHCAASARWSHRALPAFDSRYLRWRGLCQ